MTRNQLGKVKIFSLCLSRVSYEDAVQLVIEASKKNKPYFVCFANTHMVIEAYKSSKIREGISQSHLILPDGYPVAKSMSFFNKYKQDRIAGMDLIFDVLKRANDNSLKVFLFGGTEEMLERAIGKIEANYPNINLVGSISPPFNSEWDEESDVREINDANPNVVLVALGCPKQEMWMSRNHLKINATMLGLGAALPVFAGLMPRCPKWLSNNGFEWAYRLFQEPKRLFMRYFRSNFLFVYLFFIEFVKLKIGMKKPDNC